jgi:hypothetical protein
VIVMLGWPPIFSLHFFLVNLRGLCHVHVFKHSTTFLKSCCFALPIPVSVCFPSLVMMCAVFMWAAIRITHRRLAAYRRGRAALPLHSFVLSSCQI